MFVIPCEQDCLKRIYGLMGKVIKDTLHANGIDIGIYTQAFYICE